MSASVLPWTSALVGPLGTGSCVFLEWQGWHSVSTQRNQGRGGQSAVLLAKLGTLSLEEGTGARIPHVVLESAGGYPLGRLRQRHWAVGRCCHRPRPRWDLHAGNSPPSPHPPPRGGGPGLQQGNADWPALVGVGDPQASCQVCAVSGCSTSCLAGRVRPSVDACVWWVLLAPPYLLPPCFLALQLCCPNH